MRIVLAYLIGLVFGTGIVLGGMANPAKVLNFFDHAGSWDPSLIFVMAGALGVTFLGYRLVLPRPGPLFAPAFSLPGSRAIDARLVGGAALFGIGWGMAGICPGPAISLLAFLPDNLWIFLLAMFIGSLAGSVVMPSGRSRRLAHAR
jgi:uncharacterized membrane protein YedE/YeeE